MLILMMIIQTWSENSTVESSMLLVKLIPKVLKESVLMTFEDGTKIESLGVFKELRNSQFYIGVNTVQNDKSDDIVLLDKIE